MNWLPSTAKGVLIALAVLALLVVAVYAGTTLTVAVGAVVIAVLAYGIYVLGYRLDHLLKHGL